jgi:hypothetical protein
MSAAATPPTSATIRPFPCLRDFLYLAFPSQPLSSTDTIIFNDSLSLLSP